MKKFLIAAILVITFAVRCFADPTTQPTASETHAMEIGAAVIWFLCVPLRRIGTMGEGRFFTLATQVSRITLNLVTIGAEIIHRQSDKDWAAKQGN